MVRGSGAAGFERAFRTQHFDERLLDGGAEPVGAPLSFGIMRALLVYRRKSRGLQV
ncbi:hypothetical protein [Paraburkholderia nodosa]|uniref:hypothetical protein n=1 Tax=Paraburkholderia nodosa TaxID=392320 RepID=UPI00159F00A2|nr:hypothetical protein [Paraburkholderia nodosa]